jgi:integrase
MRGRYRECRPPRRAQRGVAIITAVLVVAFLASLGAKAGAALMDITPRDVEAFMHTRLANGRNPSTVKVDLKTLNTPFALALRQGLILSNPVAAAEPLKAEKENREPFTFEEIRQLIAAADGEWKTAIILGAFTGLRLGDCPRLLRHRVERMIHASVPETGWTSQSPGRPTPAAPGSLGRWQSRGKSPRPASIAGRATVARLQYRSSTRHPRRQWRTA